MFNGRGYVSLPGLCAINIYRNVPPSLGNFLPLQGEAPHPSANWRGRRASSIHQSSRWRCPVSVVPTTEHENSAHSFHPFPFLYKQSGKWKHPCQDVNPVIQMSNHNCICALGIPLGFFTAITADDFPKWLLHCQVSCSLLSVWHQALSTHHLLPVCDYPRLSALQ